MQELEAARPDYGKKTPKARETREYWYHFVAATETNTQEHMAAVFDMAVGTLRAEICRAKRIVNRFREIEEIERTGGTVPQTHVLAPLLQPGQQIYKAVSSPSLNVIFKIKQTDDGTKNGVREQSTRFSSSPSTTSTCSTLLSVRMKSTLYRLQAALDVYPRDLPHVLATLASRFEAPIELLDETEHERLTSTSCETDDTLAVYRLWYTHIGEAILEEHGCACVASCLSHIRSWRDDVLEAEEAGDEKLEETFLEVVMRRLEDVDEVEDEVEGAERRCDEAAWELQLLG